MFQCLVHKDLPLANWSACRILKIMNILSVQILYLDGYFFPSNEIFMWRFSHADFHAIFNTSFEFKHIGENVIQAFVWKACCKNGILCAYTKSYEADFPSGFCQHFLLSLSTNFWGGKARKKSCCLTKRWKLKSINS